MTPEAAPSPAASVSDPIDHPRAAPDDVGPAKAIDLLFDEARSTVEDQIGLARAFAAAAGVTARSVAIFAALALLLALVALLVLAIGAMLALTPALGQWAATALVGGVLLILAAICALMIRRAITRFQHAANGGEPW